MQRNHKAVSLAAAIVLAAACHSTPSSRPPEMAAPTGLPVFADPATHEAIDGQELTVDFGSVCVGTLERREVLLANAGTATFTVVEIRPSDGFPTAIQHERSSFSVDAHRYAAFALTFAPIAAGEVSGSVQFVIDNGIPDSLVVRVRGLGVQGTSPELVVGPTQLDFGAVAPNDGATRSVTVANVGYGAAHERLWFGAIGTGGSWVDRAPEVVGPDRSAFTVDWPPAGYERAGIAEGTSVELRVRFGPTSPGRKEATLVVYSNDPSRPRAEVPMSGAAIETGPCDFALSPLELNFGAIARDGEATLELTLSDLDGDPSHQCRISGLDLTPATQAQGAFALVGGPLSAAVLRSGDSIVVPVRFNPRAESAFAGAIEIQVTDPRRPFRTVPLSGVGLGDCLVVAPKEIDFGFTPLWCRRERSLLVYNVCSGATAISYAGFAQGREAAFELTRRPALPRSIPGGSYVEFGVRFSASGAGEQSSVIEIGTGPGSDPRRVVVWGVSAVDPVQTDVFSQSDQPKVDVLFIVDNSATMADKQASLARNFGYFIRDALQSNVDFHLAVTTTDVTATGAAGRFLPLTGNGPRVITASTPDAEQAFLRNVAVGMSGSETESLIRPAYLALTQPLIAGHNDGFYRDEARLDVVIVSDAADQDPLSTPVSFYESFLLNLKGTKHRDATVSAVIPTAEQAPEGCSYDSATASTQPAVRQLVQRTGGMLEDICDFDWSHPLSAGMPRSFGLRSVFYLSNLPDLSLPDPIVVTVDGRWFPQYDAYHGEMRWDYDSRLNAVRFEPLAVPAPGSTLSISYRVACWP